MKIIPATIADAQKLAAIISRSNRDVAQQFGLTNENAAKHPSFCTAGWIRSDFQNGQVYFSAMADGAAAGCVAFQQPDTHTAYLNRLSVLPEFRRRGIGTALVHHIMAYAKEKNLSRISIGIIAENTRLKKWYTRLGFKDFENLKFDHLPFDVLIMDYQI